MSDNLNDPRNPRSPYNRYNWDSPFSVTNPHSPHYNQKATTDYVVQCTLAVISFPVVIGIVSMLAIFMREGGDGGLSSVGLVVGMVIAALTLVGVLYLVNNSSTRRR